MGRENDPHLDIKCLIVSHLFEFSFNKHFWLSNLQFLTNSRHLNLIRYFIQSDAETHAVIRVANLKSQYILNGQHTV